MVQYKRFINDDQWKVFEPRLRKSKGEPKGGYSPIDNRQIIEGSFASEEIRKGKGTKWILVVKA
jgi:hypothetical protein